MTLRQFGTVLLLVGLVGLVGCATASGNTPEEKIASIHRMKDETLARLYKEEPAAKANLESAPGYAVFSNIGTNVIFVSTGQGYGMAVDNSSGKITYMQMGEVGVGLGLGVKDFRAVFVFHTPEVMNRFVESGWDFGAEADAAATSGDKGAETSGAVSIGGMTVYQLTEAGLALSATVSGTKYWKDDELN